MTLLSSVYIKIDDELINPDVFLWYYLLLKESKMKGLQELFERQSDSYVVVNGYLGM